MYHSRAAALLTGDYCDRVIEATTTIVTPPVGVTVAWTYTVGANILARVENSFILVEGSTAVNQVTAAIRTNRTGVIIPINQIYAPVGGSFQTSPLAHNLLLQAGDVADGIYFNGDGVSRTIQVAAHFREIDL